MDRIKVLIVEDELLVAQDLKFTLEEHHFNVVDILDTGEAVLKRIGDDTPDLILMDIHLAGKLDGIETAKKILETVEIPIIYLSDHVDQTTFERAKSTFPANYLSKPFKPGDVLRSLELAFLNASTVKKPSISKLSDRVFIRTDNKKSEMIFYKDILYLEAARAYCNIVTKNKTYILSNNMRKVFEQFDNPDFIKIQRSYIVNINSITGIEGNIIKMGEGHSVQMSPRNREMILNKLNLVK
ncbi:response regulator [Fulvivirgaceae bacterium BMA12]|uniref:Response regulator n=1 Tax=Agaribacillus aureus TaxID=3051825 RepID=A0ABT8LB22_9BACT|nr:response regulator [Fulvivirgaceae bacterium BMA12]